MPNTREPAPVDSGELMNDRIDRDDEIAAEYAGRPSLRSLRESGRIDQEACEAAERIRAAGPPERPFRDLMAALRAERERQGLSLADLAERTGIDRAAIHKLEIGVNINPTLTTLTRRRRTRRGSSGISRPRPRASRPRRECDETSRRPPDLPKIHVSSRRSHPPSVTPPPAWSGRRRR